MGAPLTMALTLHKPPRARPGRHGMHARGEDNGAWNGERLYSSHGYVKVRVGKGHPLADPNGYAYEHTLVWAAAGRVKPDGRFAVIHHRNGNKTDNRLENLEAMSRREHKALHNGTRNWSDLPPIDQDPLGGMH